MRRLTRVLTTKQIRGLEQAYIADCRGNWGQVLMEIAGRGAAQVAFDLWQESPGKVSIFCGRGNNGGDGLVVARYLHLWKVPVEVLLVGQKASGGNTAPMNSEESTINHGILQSLKVQISELHSASDIEPHLEESSLIVDGLFGTGLTRPLEGIYTQTIEALNQSGLPILAIDIPSGINSDTGQIMGSAIEADCTVTFGYLKTGHFCHPGATHCGTLTLVDIGLPEAKDQSPRVHLASAPLVDALLPTRPTNSNKGTFGHLLTIAGSLGMAGAAVLSAESSLRTGAGLVILATPKSLVANLPACEVIYRGMPENKDGRLGLSALNDLNKQIEPASAIVLGPGFGLDDDTTALVHQLVATIKKPCIIDADALNAIAKNTSVFPKDSAHILITPHPKELSRLMQSSTDVINKDRVGAALEAAKKFGCTVLLKGAYTVVADQNGNVFFNPTGNPGMATAGSGDVLSGIAGGLLAQGLSPFEAGVAAAYIHGRAGDLAVEAIGETGITAGDMSTHVPQALHSIKQGTLSKVEEEIFNGNYGSLDLPS